MDTRFASDDISVSGLTADFREPQTLGLHQHLEGQLVYAATGVVVVGTDGGYYVVPPTRALWLAPGVRHWARTSGNVQLRSVFLTLGDSAALRAKCCVLNMTPLMREVISTLAGKESELTMSTRDTALTTLLLHELDEVPVLPLHLPALKDSRLARVERHVLGKPHQRIALAAWAGKLNIDKRTLHRLFVKETGMPYRRWLQQAQLLIALEWLADGKRLIDIASGLGYSSQSAFTVMFKRNLGVPPGVFFSSSIANAETQ